MEIQSSAPGVEEPYTTVQAGDWLGRQHFAGEDLGGLSDKKLQSAMCHWGKEGQ